jgi:hypothetical protein
MEVARACVELSGFLSGRDHRYIAPSRQPALAHPLGHTSRIVSDLHVQPVKIAHPCWQRVWYTGMDLSGTLAVCVGLDVRRGARRLNEDASAGCALSVPLPKGLPQQSASPNESGRLGRRCLLATVVGIFNRYISPQGGFGTLPARREADALALSERLPARAASVPYFARCPLTVDPFRGLALPSVK